ncbi:hypothetical protein [Kitasatospora sp. NPDC090308]|uniref:hypothetical protein n=1 Tax=Kitasatospora sp. NPDC090308 TaxID=3364082 RepID=UPI0037FFFAE4
MKAFTLAQRIKGITGQEVRLSRLDGGGYRLHWQSNSDRDAEAATLPAMALSNRYGYSSRTRIVWMEVDEPPDATGPS